MTYKICEKYYFTSESSDCGEYEAIRISAKLLEDGRIVDIL